MRNAVLSTSYMLNECQLLPLETRKLTWTSPEERKSETVVRSEKLVRSPANLGIS